MDIFNDDSNFVFLLNAMGKKIKVNDKEVQALISNFKDMRIDYKKIKTIVPFRTGDIISYQNQNWLVISEVSQNNSIYKATMRKCQYTLKFYNKREKIFETPCILDVNNQGVKSGKLFDYLDGKMDLYIKDTEAHRKLKEDKRFMIMGYVWKVEGISRELPGLIHLYCQKTSFVPEDNRDLEIAYNSDDTIEKPTEPTTPIDKPTIPITSVYSLQGSDTLDTKIIQTYTVVDQNNIPVIDKEFSWKLTPIGSTSPATLIIPKGSTVNSYSLLGKSQYTKGSFVLVATCKTDESIVIKKEIRVI